MNKCKIRFQATLYYVIIFNFFVNNGLLFHNDTHNENVLFINTGKISYKNVKLAIIDFGKSTLFQKFDPSNTGFRIGNITNSIEDKLDAFNGWLNKTKNSKDVVYGGSRTYRKRKARYSKKNKTLKL